MKKTLLTLVTVIATVTILAAQEAERETIYFDYNKHELTADSKMKLEKISKSMDRKETLKLEIAGYTDSDGSDSYNNALSKSRAVTVQDFLESRGMEKNKIEVNFYGEKNPAASNENAEGRRENRRVEIRWEYAGFTIPQEFQAKTKSFVINPVKDTAVTLTSKGTVLYIPGNCFADMNGKVVKEHVNLKYTEYANSADMAFSQIPMTYKSKGEVCFFNSSGMFEIKGSANGSAVQVAKNKSMKIDYALAKKNPDIDFYQLKADGNWQKVQDIKPAEKDTLGTDSIVYVAIGDWETDTVVFDKHIVFVNGGSVRGMKRINANGKANTLLGGGGDVGHSYPDIIRGLNVDSFGVYNCDQIYYVPDLVSIEANYVDKEGKKIKDLQVLSLIDLNYNGAFSFSPLNFQCGAKGKNVLALFTKDKKLYVLGKSEFAKMKIDKSGHYTFTMEDMTDRIKSSKDLADYLGIKL